MSKVHSKSRTGGDRARTKKNSAVVPMRSNSLISGQPSTGDYPTELQLSYRTLKACRSDNSAHRRDDLDQCPATIKTTLRRLALLKRMSGIEKRRVLLLGDDDLLSVALATAGVSESITVIDLDRSLLSRIARWTKSGMVELIHHDLRLGLPDAMAHCYDVVFTDPPYTTAGQLLFLRAGLVALRNTRSSSMFLCASRLYLRVDQIQMIIGAAGHAGLRLVQTEEDFNEYKAPPDVVEDIRNREGQRKTSYLYSSLFHFKPRGDVLSPESLSLLPAEIYKYEGHNAPS